MSKLEISTNHLEEQHFYQYLGLRLEQALFLHNGHGEYHAGMSNDLEVLLTTMQSQGFLC